ncbi:MAG: AAA family ATPase [Roseofilum sp. SID2]|uniref:AAA family ATPase n=1 Tax=unclassified Roseofilum TaxID=2620099 RepID=UPI001B02B867|nr:MULTISPECIES: AAA family ATPase [unclassified Roseofilum]MBP0013609.1 AAA family ATPase [Roseofilum sp. SID3]MBP0026741.1 AAA family ATPase [Roseofilum sp. SID2]MBP0039341.1 AAA family ATPase [Roseofilum sp. SID1]
MKIEKISITGLFGVFDHVISLNQEDRITIIHGPNGFGKTSILRLIDGLFNSNYSVFNSIPFTNLKVDFDDGNTLDVTLEINDDYPDGTPCISHSSDPNNNFYTQSTIELSQNTIDLLSILTKSIPELHRIDRNEWLYIPTNEIFSFADIIYYFEDRIPQRFLRDIKKPDWLEKIQKNINIKLVKSQRLASFYSRENSEDSNLEVWMQPTILEYAQELADLIRSARTEYGTVSQSLDRTFPVRLVQHSTKSKFTKEELRYQLDALEKHRYHLIDLGLLDRGEDSEFQIPKTEIDKSTQSILSVYIEDVKKKLDVFQKVAKKIELFRKVINHKFQYSYKKIQFDEEHGFVVTVSDHPLSYEYNGQILDLTELSSGEQHELVLLYELLFKVKPNSLVLIDEPELSMHVGWQSEFLQDLQDIIKLADIDILMATHSPDIIQDRWNWTVELKRPKS